MLLHYTTFFSHYSTVDLGSFIIMILTVHPHGAIHSQAITDVNRHRKITIKGITSMKLPVSATRIDVPRLLLMHCVTDLVTSFAHIIYQFVCYSPFMILLKNFCHITPLFSLPLSTGDLGPLTQYGYSFFIHWIFGLYECVDLLIQLFCRFALILFVVSIGALRLRPVINMIESSPLYI